MTCHLFPWLQSHSELQYHQYPAMISRFWYWRGRYVSMLPCLVNLGDQDLHLAGENQWGATRGGSVAHSELLGHVLPWCTTVVTWPVEGIEMYRTHSILRYFWLFLEVWKLGKRMVKEQHAKPGMLGHIHMIIECLSSMPGGMKPKWLNLMRTKMNQCCHSHSKVDVQV